MGESKRRIEQGLSMRPLKQGEQIQVDIKNAVPRYCSCGGKYFLPAVSVYIISALLSPTGQELLVQQPVLTCMDCKELLKLEET